jgi:hypothetical protein
MPWSGYGKCGQQFTAVQPKGLGLFNQLFFTGNMVQLESVPDEKHDPGKIKRPKCLYDLELLVGIRSRSISP